MMVRRAVLTITLALGVCLGLGCKADDHGSDAESAPAKAELEVLTPQANGSPVAAKFVKFTGDGERGVEVLLYNAGDRTAFSYSLLLRYYDADDKLLRIEVGTPVEGDTDFLAVADKGSRCEPEQNQTVMLRGGGVRVPAAAVRAEVMVTRVSAPVSGGNRIDTWFSQPDEMAWPAD